MIPLNYSIAHFDEKVPVATAYTFADPTACSQFTLQVRLTIFNNISGAVGMSHFTAATSFIAFIPI